MLRTSWHDTKQNKCMKYEATPYVSQVNYLYIQPYNTSVWVYYMIVSVYSQITRLGTNKSELGEVS